MTILAAGDSPGCYQGRRDDNTCTILYTQTADRHAEVGVHKTKSTKVSIQHVYTRTYSGAGCFFFLVFFGRFPKIPRSQTDNPTVPRAPEEPFLRPSVTNYCRRSVQIYVGLAKISYRRKITALSCLQPYPPADICSLLTHIYSKRGWTRARVVPNDRRQTLNIARRARTLFLATGTASRAAPPPPLSPRQGEGNS